MRRLALVVTLAAAACGGSDAPPAPGAPGGPPPTVLAGRWGLSTPAWGGCARGGGTLTLSGEDAHLTGTWSCGPADPAGEVVAGSFEEVTTGALAGSWLLTLTLSCHSATFVCQTPAVQVYFQAHAPALEVGSFTVDGVRYDVFLTPPT